MTDNPTTVDYEELYTLAHRIAGNLYEITTPQAAIGVAGLMLAICIERSGLEFDAILPNIIKYTRAHFNDIRSYR